MAEKPLSTRKYDHNLGHGVMRFSLDIGSLGRRGEGLVRLPEGIVHVPFALPGEKVEADVEGMRGTLVAVQHASPQRISPPCPYHGRCGGCSLQHFQLHAYGEWKTSLIISALKKYGLSAPVRALRSAHGAGRRRVVLHARRIASGQPAVGFMASRSHQLVEIDHCLVLAPELHPALSAARAFARLLITDAPAFDLQFTNTRGGLDCDLRGLPRNLELPLAALADVSRRFDLSRVSVHGRPVLTLSEPAVDCAGTKIVLPPGAFLQATLEGEQALAQFVLEHLGKSRRAADLFCGVGTFALRLARTVPVLAVDADKPAIRALSDACRMAQGLKPVTAVVRNLFREPLTSDELQDVDLLVFDPPRQGAEAQVRQLAASRLKTIIAISCDPLTFARDAAILVAGGYELKDVLPVDQFQWSAHVEIAALFVRGSKPRRMGLKAIGPAMESPT
jgi:23S rRNA (uracil1939-C5)-methyltransferase